VRWGVFVAGLVTPTMVWACPACARASLESAVVYYIATALMLLVPFVLLGGLVIWLKRARNMNDENRSAS